MDVRQETDQEQDWQKRDWRNNGNSNGNGNKNNRQESTTTSLLSLVVSIVYTILLYVLGQALIDDDIQGQYGGQDEKEESVVKQVYKALDKALDASPNYLSVCERLVYRKAWKMVDTLVEQDEIKSVQKELRSIGHIKVVYWIIILLIVSHILFIKDYFVHLYDAKKEAPDLPRDSFNLVLYFILLVMLSRWMYYFYAKCYRLVYDLSHLLSQGDYAHPVNFVSNKVELKMIEHSNWINYLHTFKPKRGDIDNNSRVVFYQGVSIYSAIIWTVIPLSIIQFNARVLLQNKEYDKDKNQSKFIKLNYLSCFMSACLALGLFYLVNSGLEKWLQIAKMDNLFHIAPLLLVPFVLAPFAATVYVGAFQRAAIKPSNQMFCEVQTVAIVALVIIMFVLYIVDIDVGLFGFDIPLGYIVALVIVAVLMIAFLATPKNVQLSSQERMQARVKAKYAKPPPEPTHNKTLLPTQFKTPVAT